MPPIEDHPLRYSLVNELHARPFPVLKAPCRAAYLAIKPATNAAARDREADRAHLIALLDRYGAPHPQPDATHYFGDIGDYRLKWESHTEFVTYTIFADGTSDRPFEGQTFEVFPDDWLAKAPGVRIASVLVRVELISDETAITEKIGRWFVSESRTVSRVLEDSAVIAGDFRLDPAGNMRFAVFARSDAGTRRVGRIVQRLCEIETYKTMSMLGLTRARELEPKMGALDLRLSKLMGEMTSDEAQPDATLEGLLKISSELETILAQSSFRFGATKAYGALVNQRAAILGEDRFKGGQTLSEFLARRFAPAMRTVNSTEARLQALAERAMRAGELLRTRVDVERSAQNHAVLESMDHRAGLQLNLQRTVEGFSVAAISYYAVNLISYMAFPTLEPLGLSKGWTTAVITPFVIVLVFFVIRRMRDKLD